MRISFVLIIKLTRKNPRKRHSSYLKLFTKHSIIQSKKVRIRAVIALAPFLEVHENNVKVEKSKQTQLFNKEWKEIRCSLILNGVISLILYQYKVS